MRTLWVLPHSPWSERARWALLHHRVSFEEKAHVPFIGEPLLRWRAKQSHATVPLLVDEAGPTMGSLLIAERAEALAQEATTPLFPSERRQAIVALDAEIELVFRAARAIIVTNIATDDAAALEGVPKGLRFLPGAAASAKMASRYVGKKYAASLDGAEAKLREGLLSVRGKVAGRKYVHDAFTYADVIAATLVHFITPPAREFIRMGPAMRRAWTHDGLAKEFADLVVWRDGLYAACRPPSS